MLGVSRTTTTRVYAELREGGLLNSRQGSGSVVRVPFVASSASSLIVTPDDADTIALTYAAPVGPHGHDAFAGAGGRLSVLPVGDTPWEPAALAATLRSSAHRAAYFIPEFHNPTGAIMSDSERSAWAHELRRHNVIPVVDESLRDINLDGVELPASYASYDPRALIVGSSSKSFWAGLRVGWIRAPRSLVMPLVQARMMDDLGTSACPTPRPIRPSARR